MNYRCPKCAKRLAVSRLLFRDISACKECGQKVVLGDFMVFLVAALAMLVMALSALYLLTERFQDPVVAGGYALAAGTVMGMAVLILLGRAIPYKRIRSSRPRSGPPPAAAAKP